MRSASLLLGAALLLLACGRVVPKGGHASDATAAPRMAPAFEPRELIPADLDLVVRLDLRALGAALGDALARELIRSALAASNLDAVARQAVESADVVGFAGRLEELAEGDHVLVLEGRQARHEPPSLDRWRLASSPRPDVARYVARGRHLRRDTSELFDLAGGRVLASPVEAASVRRVLAHGPDPERGDPEARGLLSVVVRPRPPSEALVRRHPALGGLLREITFVDGVVEERARQLALTAHLRCRSSDGAARLGRFLVAFREASDASERLREPLRALEVGVAERLVTLRWTGTLDRLEGLLVDAAPHDTSSPADAPSE